MAQLPRVKITFASGLLGKVGDSPDGLLALLVSSTAVGKDFALDTPYSIRSVADLEGLGVTKKNNPVLSKHVRDYYAEAVEGTELVIYGVDKKKTMLELVTKGDTEEEAGALRQLITLSKGRLRGVAVALDAQDEPEATEGLTADVISAIPKAQETAVWATETLYAPLFVLLEGRGFNRQGLKDLSELDCNRVAVFVGDTEEKSKGSAVGLLAGRIARLGIEKNVGRVKEGSINAERFFLSGKPLETQSGAVADLYSKGYISPRQHVGRVGYYFSDDRLATALSDDYAQLTARRTIDKAYRIAYDTLLSSLLDDLEVEADGSLHPAVIRSWEEEVTGAIDRAMTARKELSADSDSGSGCRFTIAPGNILSTSTITAHLGVRPKGYARYIDVTLGFLVSQKQ